jgi:threonine/homoserine/homoserine lactone efflux protein
MTESIINISVIGLLAGFFSSMPVAGPVSVLITSNALIGRLRYCNSLIIGASFATFTYVFFAAFGLTKLFTGFKAAIPYLLTASFAILIIVGIRIFRIKIAPGYFEDNSLSSEPERKSERSGFYTGLIINFLNPTLLIGWIINTFIVISFTASLGLNTGGLDIFIHESAKEINDIIVADTADVDILSIQNSDIAKISVSEFHDSKPARYPKYYHMTISVIYALFAAAGSILWFLILTFLIVRFRKFINYKLVSAFIKSMGIVLCFFGLYSGFLAFKMVLQVRV